MLAAQQAVVTAANAVVVGLSEGDAAHSEVVAAKMVLTDAEAAVAATQMAIDDAATLAAKSDPLTLTGGAAQKAVKTVNSALRSPPSGSTTAAEWLKQDPREGTFVKYVDSGADVTGALFSASGSRTRRFRSRQSARRWTPVPCPATNVGDILLPAFKASTSKDAPSLGTGWMGAVHEREYKRDGSGTLTAADDVVVMDMVTTYTNQDPAGDEYYATYYRAAGQDEIAAGDFADTDGALILADGRSKLAKSGGLPSGVSQMFEYDGGAGHKPVLTGDNVLQGTFNGVPGKFSCTNADCTASTNASGALSIDGGNAGMWVFTPNGDPEKIVVEGVIPDVDYLTFGYWVETTTDTSTTRPRTEPVWSYVYTHSPQISVYHLLDGYSWTRRSSARPVTIPAAGIFARRAYDPESGGDVETAGRFTADASLTADFDARTFYLRRQRPAVRSPTSCTPVRQSIRRVQRHHFTNGHAHGAYGAARLWRRTDSNLEFAACRLPGPLQRAVLTRHSQAATPHPKSGVAAVSHNRASPGLRGRHASDRKTILLVSV